MRTGASGIQVGTAFAFCAESGIEDSIKRQTIQLARAGKVKVFTDPVASPTGFPFKVLQLSGTLSDALQYAARERNCDLGYLRHVYRKEDGTPGYRCPAEPVDEFVRKGGTLADAAGRKCLCNGLVSNIGLAQIRSGTETELPLLTAGDNVSFIPRFLKPGADSYTAAEVIEQLLDETAPVNGAAPAKIVATPMVA